MKFKSGKIIAELDLALDTGLDEKAIILPG